MHLLWLRSLLKVALFPAGREETKNEEPRRSWKCSNQVMATTDNSGGAHTPSQAWTPHPPGLQLSAHVACIPNIACSLHL